MKGKKRLEEEEEASRVIMEADKERLKREWNAKVAAERAKREGEERATERRIEAKVKELDALDIRVEEIDVQLIRLEMEKAELRRKRTRLWEQTQ
jgi:hypothetical protein